MTDKTLNIILKATDKASGQFDRISKAASGLSGRLKQTEQEQMRLNKALNDTKRLEKYRQNLSETNKKLSENRNRQRELLAEMKKSGGATQEQSREMKKLAQQAKILEQTQERQLKSTGRLAKEMKAAGTSTVNLAQNQKTLAEQMEKTNKKFAAQQKWANVSRKLDDINSKAIMASGVAAAHAYGAKRLLEKPITAYAQSETASVDLRAAMMKSDGSVSAEYEKINSLATKLGDKLPGTTADFKNLMTMLMRQGVSAQTILGGTGEAAAMLSVQLKKAPDAAAEMTAKLQDATRANEKEMLAIMDQVQRLYYTGVEDGNILGAFSKLSPALDTLKIKGEAAMKQMGPLVGMLDQAGLSGESAGNAMRKVFTRMMDTAKIAKATKGSGIDLDFTNGKGEFGGFDKMYAQLEKLKSLTTEKRLGILQKIFGDDAETLQALNTMIEKGKTGYEEFAKKMEAQASLNQRVNEQLGTLTNLWDAASGTFTNFLATMGESVAPELKSLTQWIADVNSKLSTWAAQNPTAAAAIMKLIALFAVGATVISSLGLAVHGITGVMSGFMTIIRFAGGGIGTLIGWIGRLGMVLGSFGLKAAMFLVTNPFGWAILAVGALVALYVYWDKVEAALIAGWKWIEQVFQNNPLLGAFMGPIGVLIALLANWKKVEAALVAGWEWLKKVFGGENPIAQAAQVALAPLNALKSAAMGAYEWVKKAFSTKAPTAPGGSASGYGLGTYIPNKGYSTGGYTGAGGINTPAGIVHKGEVVFNQRDVARFGGWRVLDKIRKAGLTALGSILPSSAPEPRPALAGAVPVAADFNRGGGGGMNINITINGGSSSAAEIAREVRRQIEQMTANAARRARSAFKDD
ncbi:phage tail tape measure protein [Neisseria sp. HMSC064F04]|uniref:phage tail tape measure protein n=1 Tax=Neisseria mucosa TaxID=488 RepID=UPI0008A96089|nr:phage tail tape measure protein [Neisseria mucosa]OHR40335.1 phage tail tape measure protein [Neisseria sp. HMSC064F04]